MTSTRTPPTPPSAAAAAHRPVGAELRAELERGPAWMYPWPLGDGTVTPTLSPELADLHRSRQEMMEDAVRAALSAAGPGARAIDLACNEGWFCHRLLEWGASEVVGLDIRADNLRRARLMRDHAGISPRRLRLVQADLFEVAPRRLGRFDVVLLLGLVYHVEDPIGALRLARALTDGLCVVESQLTRQTEPIEFGWGVTGSRLTADASFAMLVEHDAWTNPLAAREGSASLVPNAAALEAALRVAGFSQVRAVEPRPHHNAQYLAGDRALFLAWHRGAPAGVEAVARIAAAARGRAQRLRARARTAVASARRGLSPRRPRGLESPLPPAVAMDLDQTVGDLWHRRAAQHLQDRYAGVRITKFPEDLRVYEHLLWASAADTVIEIGCFHGGSALWFRDRLRTMAAYGRIGPHRVITIDRDMAEARARVAAADPSMSGLVFLEGDVTDPALPDRVARLVPRGARCMVVEDSAHTAATTSAALRGFARFVPPGGFFVVEDGCVDVERMRASADWPRGVLPALQEWLATPEGRRFRVRRDLELYGITCHPGGFLERVR